MIRTCLIGSSGRMGNAVRDLSESEKIEITAAIDKENGGSFLSSVKNSDVVLDFSFPEATTQYLSLLNEHSIFIPYVIGCTGWSEEQLKVVQSYSKKACVVLAPNFSLGVNVMLALAEMAAKALTPFGYSIKIQETHHVHKKDAPSGTAKALHDVMKFSSNKISTESMREGEVVGKHEVFFSNKQDQLSITHEAFDRKLFAHGALIATRWAAERNQNEKKAGLFNMREILLELIQK